MIQEVWLGDCLELMPKIPDGSVDLVLCDLPYGITQNKWDCVIPLDKLWESYYRVCGDTTPVVLTASQPFTSILVTSNLKDFKYDWVWRKPKGTGHLNAKKMPMRDKEDILVFYRKQCTYNPQFTLGPPYKNKAGKDFLKTSSMTESYGNYTNFRNNNDGKRYPKQVQDFPVVERGTLHPTQKPVQLMEYLIKTYTNEGDLVLDNCAGSGTTLVAAKSLNRQFIGIEKEKKYYDICIERLGKINDNTKNNT